MFNHGLTEPLTTLLVDELRTRANRGRGISLTATSVAASGHPGGSLSSMEIYTLLYSLARLDPAEPRWIDRDRIVVSHGHTSPGVYAALALAGFFDPEQVEAHFRQAGSVFEGHVERSVPGVEWSTGNLGQGLSAGVGLALGARLTGADWHTFVAMSDGEQMKGQVSEARRLAVKESLGNLTAVIDLNHVQISGHTEEVMPVEIAHDWAADGWRVYECDGHNIEALHLAVAEAVKDGEPSVVLARTYIGQGVSFMHDVPEFHGRALTDDEYHRAMGELGLESGALDRARAARAGTCTVTALEHQTPAVALCTGTARTYGVGTKADNRGAWGHALVDLASANPDVPFAVFDCDLAVSVKTDSFAVSRPQGFIQCGVGEHNAATASGALSTVPGVVSFWSDFGAFGIDEAFNQQRLNDINGAALKLAVTHCGLDVGEDGKTHQCLDYVGAFREMFGWRVIVPADPNQTDRAVRWAAAAQGNVAVAMGRSKLPIIAAEDGSPLFADDHEFAYGEIVRARAGCDVTLMTMGTVAGAAVAAADALRAEGISVAVDIVACPLHLDHEAMKLAASSTLIVTAEDHNVRTGLGCSVAEWIAESGAPVRLVRLGVEGFRSSGSAGDILAHAGLDAESIAGEVRAAVGR